MMRWMTAVAAAALFTQPAAAQQGAPMSPLATCLTSKTTAADRMILVRWTFVAMSAHPELAGLAQVTPAERTAQDRAMATVVQRLMTVDCRSESKIMMTGGASGKQVVGDAFGKLGEAAMQSLMNHPAVNKAIGAFVLHVDMNAVIKALMTDEK